MIVALFFLSMAGGIFSGLLGVGGAVVLIPLLLNVPPLVGAGSLTMSQVSGITMVQVLAASITGYLVHSSSGYAHRKTILTIGIPMGILSLTGAALSASMDNDIMLVIFGVLVLVALAIMIQRPAAGDVRSDDDTSFSFNGWLSAIVGGSVGIVSGIVGAGGGFILVPIMIRILRIPIRVVVGSSLGILFIGSLMGTVGKLATFQVELLYLLPVLLGSVPASVIGAKISKRLPQRWIRYLLVGLMVVILITTWIDILR